MISPFPCCPVNRKCHVRETPDRKKERFHSILLTANMLPASFPFMDVSIGDVPIFFRATAVMVKSVGLGLLTADNEEEITLLLLPIFSAVFSLNKKIENF